jgi:hypothetical protein
LELAYNIFLNKCPNCYENLAIDPFYSRVRVRIMVFNATFNNISAISLQSVLLVEETGVPSENHRPVASH